MFIVYYHPATIRYTSWIWEMFACFLSVLYLECLLWFMTCNWNSILLTRWILFGHLFGIFAGNILYMLLTRTFHVLFLQLHWILWWALFFWITSPCSIVLEAMLIIYLSGFYVSHINPKIIFPAAPWQLESSSLSPFLTDSSNFTPPWLNREIPLRLL